MVGAGLYEVEVVIPQVSALAQCPGRGVRTVRSLAVNRELLPHYTELVSPWPLQCFNS